jgi:CheY-like chemotaxis protein
MEPEFDLSQHFSVQYTVPEPVLSAEAERDVDRLGIIGVAALRDKGYYTRVVVENVPPVRKLLNPNKIRVLIVEDDEGMALLIEKVLHTSGLQTLRARNRAEIVQGLSGKPAPHLVLLDILLPDADGFDVLNRIRHHPAIANMPVLLLTSLGEGRDVARGLQLGANGYITKPVLPSVLLEAIQTVIAG